MTIDDKAGKQIFDAIESLREEIGDRLGLLEERLLLRLDESQRRIITLEATNDRLARRVETLERANRKNSVVIFGLQLPKKQDIPDFVVSQLCHLLGIELGLSDIDDIHAIGKSGNVVKVRFVSYLRKIWVLKNSSKLEGQNIYINNDLTLKEREENQILRTHLRLAKVRGKDAFIRNGSLIIDGKSYSVRDLQTAESHHERIERSNSEPGDLYSTPEAKSAAVYKSHKILQRKNSPVVNSTSPRRNLKTSGSSGLGSNRGKKDKKAEPVKASVGVRVVAAGVKVAGSAGDAVSGRVNESKTTENGEDEANGAGASGLKMQTRGRIGSGSQSTK